MLRLENRSHGRCRDQKKHNAIIEDYFYACCPFCKTPLTQGKSGTDSFNLCPTCAAYLHVLNANL